MTMLTKLFRYITLMTHEFATRDNLFPTYSLLLFVGNCHWSAKDNSNSLYIHILLKFMSKSSYSAMIMVSEV